MYQISSFKFHSLLKQYKRVMTINRMNSNMEMHALLHYILKVGVRPYRKHILAVREVSVPLRVQLEDELKRECL